MVVEASINLSINPHHTSHHSFSWLKHKKKNQQQENKWKRDEEELNQVNAKNHLPYWICITIEETSEGLRSVSLKLYLSLHNFLCWVTFVCLFIYLSYFSSCVDDYPENLSLAMNINHKKFSILSIPKLDPSHHQFQPSSIIHQETSPRILIATLTNTKSKPDWKIITIRGIKPKSKTV